MYDRSPLLAFDCSHGSLQLLSFFVFVLFWFWFYSFRVLNEKRFSVLLRRRNIDFCTTREF